MTKPASLPSIELVLLFGGKHGVIRSLEPFKGLQKRVYQGHGDAINDIKVHPVIPYLFASASKDTTIRLWHVMYDSALAILGGYAAHKDQVLSIDYFHSGEYIISGSMDCTIRVWDVGRNNEDIKKRINYANDFLLTKTGPKVLPRPLEVHESHARTSDVHSSCVDCVKFIGNCFISKVYF